MQQVAEYLREAANNTGDANLKDDFARASFNSYYYAVFLEARRLIMKFDPLKENIPHADIPNILGSSFQKRFEKELRKPIYDVRQSSRIKHDIIVAINKIKEALNNGRRIRVIADYEPEQLIDFSGDSYQLCGVKASVAKNWVEETRRNCLKLQKRGTELGLIID